MPEVSPADAPADAPAGAQGPAVAAPMRQRPHAFVGPLLSDLDARVDRRLVRTFLHALLALIRWRNRAQGLPLRAFPDPAYLTYRQNSG